MRVVCKHNVGSALLDGRLAVGYSVESEFHLTVDRQYDVHAMALWRSGLALLMIDDSGLPRWQPIELFDLIDRQLPDHWEFDVGQQEDEVMAIWGYADLVRDPNHHDLLSELAPNALEVFWASVEPDHSTAPHDRPNEY